MRKYYITIILVLCLFKASSAFSLTFEEIDFEKFILNHPMMNNYDDETGYFNNTEYELKNVEQLKKDVEELSQKLDAINKQENELASKTLDISEEDEEEFWGEVNNKSKIANKLSNQIENKVDLILKNGKPENIHLYNIVTDMTRDIILPLYKKDKIILNSLPKFYSIKPNVKVNFDARNFYNFKTNDLLDYIRKARCFTSIFPESNKTLLYNSKNVDLDKIATIDLNFAFVLHPSMIWYDWQRVGFMSKRNTELISEPSEEQKKEDKISSDEEKIKLENLKKELLLLSSDAPDYINKLKELNKKIFDAEFKVNYPNLTAPEESISIFKEIYSNIYDAIKEVMKERNIDIVFNSTLPIVYDYKIKYSINTQNQGHAGINYILYYSFSGDNCLKIPSFKNQETDCLSKRWYALIDNSCVERNRFLSLKPYPMVITGGKSILSEVIKKIYDKQGINPSAYTVFQSVISKIEAFQNGDDY